MIVDTHVHLFFQGALPAEWYRRGGMRWAGHRHPYPDPTSVRIEAGLIDEDASLLVDDLRTNGVDVGVVVGLDWGVEFGEAPISPDDLHARYAQVRDANPGQFVMVAGVDPRRDDAVEIMRRAVTEHGMAGLKLYPSSGYSCADERSIRLIGVCEELNVPIIVHTSGSGFPHPTGHLSNPAYITEAQYAYPDQTFIIAHAGRPSWLREAITVAENHPHTFLEFSAWHTDRDADEQGFAKLVLDARDRVGAHRIVNGSDHLGGRRFHGAKSDIPGWISFWNKLPEIAASLGRTFTTDERDLVLYGNACRIFNLTPSSATEASEG